MSDKSRWKREGREAYAPEIPPEEVCPYRTEQKRYARDCWLAGWNEEAAEYKAQRRAAMTEISYAWVDPNSNTVAAVRQIQDILDELLQRR